MSSRSHLQKEVRDEVVQLLQSISKPVVAIFLGEKPEAHEGKVYLAHTLEETAQIAVDLANEEAVKRNYFTKIGQTKRIHFRQRQSC